MDNKGVSIVEILLSISIIGIVIILLFSLLIQVKNEDNENNVKATFIINQSTFIKAIEEDIVNYGVSSVSECSLTDANIQGNTAADNTNYICLKFNYAAPYIKDNIGFLVVYKYYKKYTVNSRNQYTGRDPAWMIQYVRGRGSGPSFVAATKVMKEVPEDIDVKNNYAYMMYANSLSTNGVSAATIVVPIVNFEGEHYDINLSLTYRYRSLSCIKSKPTSKFQCIEKK